MNEETQQVVPSAPEQKQEGGDAGKQEMSDAEKADAAKADAGKADTPKADTPVTEKPVPNAAVSAQAETPVTEKAVPSATEAKVLSEYVVTVNDATGTIVKIERLNPDSGERKELSRDEYTGILATIPAAPLDRSLGSGPMAEPSATVANLLQAYYRGVQDYFNALSL